MAADPRLAIEQTLVVLAPPSRVLAAFFEPADLAAWWHASRSVTVPRLLGPFAVGWPATDFEDEVFGPLGGTLHGTVMDYQPDTSFFVADTYWHPPEGDAIGPMAITVQVWPHDGPGTLLIVRQTAEGDGPRWERYFAVMNAGWAGALAELKQHLES